MMTEACLFGSPRRMPSGALVSISQSGKNGRSLYHMAMGGGYLVATNRLSPHAPPPLTILYWRRTSSIQFLSSSIPISTLPPRLCPSFYTSPDYPQRTFRFGISTHTSSLPPSSDISRRACRIGSTHGTPPDPHLVTLHTRTFDLLAIFIAWKRSFDLVQIPRLAPVPSHLTIIHPDTLGTNPHQQSYGNI